MNARNTALVLIGYQNDYFATDGLLRSAIDCNGHLDRTLDQTVKILRHARQIGLPVVATPLVFSHNYSELDPEPIGVLKRIKDLGAFRENHKGCQVIREFMPFDMIQFLPGNHGLNAFIGTDLHAFLIGCSAKHVVFAGAITSLSIDSTARSAAERDFKVHIISDATAAHSALEQEFYCKQIFPLYAQVLSTNQFLTRIGVHD